LQKRPIILKSLLIIATAKRPANETYSTKRYLQILRQVEQGVLFVNLRNRPAKTTYRKKRDLQMRPFGRKEVCKYWQILANIGKYWQILVEVGQGALL
jgi:hypothetical protein